jgi:hypothetical protein
MVVAVVVVVALHKRRAQHKTMWAVLFQAVADLVVGLITILALT